MTTSVGTFQLKARPPVSPVGSADDGDTEQSFREMHLTLHDWMLKELPSVSPLHPDSLELLTQGQAAEELFHFVTTRLHTEGHTRTIRAVLALADQTATVEVDHSPTKGTKSPHDESRISMLQEEIAQAEQQLVALQARIADSSSPISEAASPTATRLHDGYDNVFSATSTSPSETRVAARRALADSLSASCAAAESALPVLHGLLERTDVTSSALNMSPTSSPHEAQVVQSANLQEAIYDIAVEFLNSPADEVQLGTDVASLIDGDVHSVASMLISCVRDATRRRAGALASGQSAGSDGVPVASGGGANNSSVLDEAFSTSRDLQLRAAAACRVKMHEARICKEQTDGVVKGSAVGRVRELRQSYAGLEGERAVLAFASQAMARQGGVDGSGHGLEEDGQFESDAMLRVQRETTVRRGEAKVSELKAAVTRLVQGSVRRLTELRVKAGEMDDDGGMLKDRVLTAVDCGRWRGDMVEKAIQQAEQWDGDVRPQDTCDRSLQLTAADGQTAGGGRHTDVASAAALVRLAEVQGWRVECERVCRGLELQADVAAENREQVLQRVDKGLMENVESALQAARDCHDKEAVAVQKEMRNWAVEPGKEAAHWLFQTYQNEHVDRFAN